MTLQHADAILQAHGRFVQRADLDAGLRSELSAILADADRRMRLTILANALLPPAALAFLKRVTRWRPGGLMHRKFAVDAPVTAPQRNG